MPPIRRRSGRWTRGRRRPVRQSCGRSGMVLIELTAVIGVTSMLLAVIVTLFTAVYRMERSWSEAAAEGRELQRLAAYFGGDAHAAGNVRIDEGSGSWSFILADGRRVDYDVLAGSVRRTVRAASDQGASFAQRQELSVPATATIDVQARPFAGGRLVTLRVAGDAVSADRNPRAFDLRVDAQLGRFHLQHSEQSLSAD